MTPQERYDATLALIEQRKALCEEANAVSNTGWSAATQRFQQAHDPATMLRVYEAAEATLRVHHENLRVNGHHCAGHGTWEDWPCTDALRVMDTWLPT